MTAIMESKPLYIVTNPVQQKENHHHFYTMDHKETFKCGLSNSKTTKASSQAAFLKKVMTLLVQNYSISWRDQTPYLGQKKIVVLPSSGISEKVGSVGQKIIFF